MDEKTTFGVIVANRGFFPEHLIETGHRTIRRVLEEAGYGCVSPDFEATRHGCVESNEDAKKCARLFAEHAGEIDGIIVTLPNFGDERSVAKAVRWSGLDVPVLVQAEPDDPEKMDLDNRRDSFCGKMSICNNLRQYGISYSLTSMHTESLESPEFAHDLENFAATCRVVGALDGARFGAVGARTGPFLTVRYSEKLLESEGISVETVDLSEILAAADSVRRNSNDFKDKRAALSSYVECPGVSDEAFDRMARFGVALDHWISENDLDGVAVQCWTAIEEIYGIVPCAVMSMLSNSGVPAACEVDVTGAVSMYALQAAAGRPAAIVDWNNNYGSDPNKCVAFHCSNLPRDVFEECRMSYQAIISADVGKENAYGTIEGRVKAGPATFLRISTDDELGLMRAYAGQGRFTDDPLETFGGYGVLEVPALQTLLRHICSAGFEHHTAVALARRSEAVCEALGTYLGWEIYHHS